MAIIGMHKTGLRIGRCQNAQMLGDRAITHAKQQDLTWRVWLMVGNNAKVAYSTGHQHLVPPGFTPIWRIGRNWFRFSPIKRPPHASDQSQAIRSGALNTGLMDIGRPKPAPREGSDPFSHRALQC